MDTTVIINIFSHHLLNNVLYHMISCKPITESKESPIILLQPCSTYQDFCSTRYGVADVAAGAVAVHLHKRQSYDDKRHGSFKNSNLCVSGSSCNYQTFYYVDKYYIGYLGFRLKVSTYVVVRSFVGTYHVNFFNTESHSCLLKVIISITRSIK